MRRTVFHKSQTLSAIITLALFILAACGGGGGSVAGGGVGGTGVVASGSVTAKGSITVNGVKYEVTDASFEREGEAPVILADESETETRVGMVLEVEGELGSPNQALTIRYEDIVEGQIDSLISETTEVKVLGILGQEVIVENGLTQFDGSLDFTTIENATGFIEVNGFRRADGRIQATYLEDRTDAIPAGRLEVKGRAVVVDADTFTIQGLTVHYSGDPVLTDGDLVEVKDLNDTYDPATKTLTASSVEQVTSPGLSVSDKDQAEVEGFVEGTIDPINAGDTFSVNGQAVIYDALTVFEGGAASDLVSGTKVEAEGVLSGGIITADKIVFKDFIRIEGDAADDDSDGSFSITGLGGLTIFVDPAVTEYDEGFSSVSATDHVEIRGREITGTGNILATEIKSRGAADPRVELQAPASSFSQATDTVELLGTISVDTSDPFIFKDFNDDIISRETFYGNLTVGDLVKARGDLAGSAVSWSEIEREDE